ncbi:hypothetical protein GCM10010400_01280 [Streptomyces aculeolatus]
MSRDMSERDAADLRDAFAAVADDATAPPMPSVTDAAVAGGTRIRRRRAAAAAGGALAVVALGVTLAAGLPGMGAEERSRPATPPSGPPASSTPTESPAPSEVPSWGPTPTRSVDRPGSPAVPSNEGPRSSDSG